MIAKGFQDPIYSSQETSPRRTTRGPISAHNLSTVRPFSNLEHLNCTLNLNVIKETEALLVPHNLQIYPQKKRKKEAFFLLSPRAKSTVVYKNDQKRTHQLRSGRSRLALSLSVGSVGGCQGEEEGVELGRARKGERIFILATRDATPRSFPFYRWGLGYVAATNATIT